MDTPGIFVSRPLTSAQSLATLEPVRAVLSLTTVEQHLLWHLSHLRVARLCAYSLPETTPEAVASETIRQGDRGSKTSSCLCCDARHSWSADGSISLIAA